jgi:hypothetical protein
MKVSTGVIRRLRTRKEWRRRAQAAAIEYFTWPTGRPGREEAKKELEKSVARIRYWFDNRRSSIVIGAIQKKAVAAFRYGANISTKEAA